MFFKQLSWGRVHAWTWSSSGVTLCPHSLSIHHHISAGHIEAPYCPRPLYLMLRHFSHEQHGWLCVQNFPTTKTFCANVQLPTHDKDAHVPRTQPLLTRPCTINQENSTAYSFCASVNFLLTTRTRIISPRVPFAQQNHLVQSSIESLPIP